MFSTQANEKQVHQKVVKEKGKGTQQVKMDFGQKPVVHGKCNA